MSAPAQVTTGRPVQEVLADAVRVLTEAARVSGDWAEFVTLALAGAAANVGSVERALAGRPGSWEADGVRTLLTSTVGCGDEWLVEHRTEPVRVTVYVDEILADFGALETYEAAADELAAREELTDDEYSELDGRLEQQRERDWQEYGDLLKTAVEAAAAQLPGLKVPAVVTVDVLTFREEQRQPGAVEERLLEQARLATPLPAAWSRPPLERLAATS